MISFGPAGAPPLPPPPPPPAAAPPPIAVAPAPAAAAAAPVLSGAAAPRPRPPLPAAGGSGIGVDGCRVNSTLPSTGPWCFVHTTRTEIGSRKRASVRSRTDGSLTSMTTSTGVPTEPVSARCAMIP
ncbi:MAG: hypothetical protein EXR91_00940 [Gemmatimonadetes bacterium]|nr:hypothetical protein [Gemmatimonadota bacterium]